MTSNRKTKILHMLSGGLDSTVLLYELEPINAHAILFDYKQRHVQELIWAKHHCKLRGINFTTVELPQLKGSTLTDGAGGVVVPNRNAIMLSVAANLAESMGFDLVSFAANRDDDAEFPDCRQVFVDTFNAVLRVAGLKVQVIAPYIGRSKAWIAARGQEIGVRLTDTWSCYAGGVQPCGTCAACQKREAALK